MPLSSLGYTLSEVLTDLSSWASEHAAAFGAQLGTCPRHSAAAVDLRTLAAFLAEQLNEGVAESDVTLEVRARRELLRSLRALIPKIDAVTQVPPTLLRPKHARES
jgi:hypothetical protein